MKQSIIISITIPFCLFSLELTAMEAMEIQAKKRDLSSLENKELKLNCFKEYALLLPELQAIIAKTVFVKYGPVHQFLARQKFPSVRLAQNHYPHGDGSYRITKGDEKAVFNKTGTQVAKLSLKKNIATVCDSQTGLKIGSFLCPYYMGDLEFSADASKLLLTNSDGAQFFVRDWQVDRWHFNDERFQHEDKGVQATFDATGKFIFSVGNDDKLKMWNVERGSVMSTFENVKGMADFNHDKTVMAVSFADKIKVFDLKVMKLKCELYLSMPVYHSDQAKILINNSGTVLIVLHNEKQPQVFELETGNLLFSFDEFTTNQYRMPKIASLDSSGTKLLIKRFFADETTGYDSKSYIDVIDVQKKEILLSISASALKADFSPSANQLLIDGYSPRSEIIDAKSGTVLHVFNNLNTCKFNNAGTHVVTTSQEGSYVHDVQLIEFMETFEPTLDQAILLQYIYEIALNNHRKNENMATYKKLSEAAKKLSEAAKNAPAFLRVPLMEALEKMKSDDLEQWVNIKLDFNEYPHLEEVYDKLPNLIKRVVKPYVIEGEERQSKRSRNE